MESKKIKKILIANRGEIALRIITTARKLNITSVALYTIDEKNKKFVHEADEAYLLEGSSVNETYLNINQIIAIAKRCNANAIHPGYGFLSENIKFAQAIIDSGLIWIGPSPSVMQLLSDKIEATKFASSIGIPTVPFYMGNANELAELNYNYEFPLLIKAAAGGGGRGMKIVEQPAQLPDALQAASREALAYFGDDRLFITPYFPKIRHIEVQIMADKEGNVVHFFDRECTFQRRYQKIIEEAPVTSIDPVIRNQILNDAVKIATSAGYDNAGTVEFMLLPDGKYYFLEVNTRIQVEHPVSEQITGYDLIELQIRSAAGEKLPLTQSDIQPVGHAIECRICAEDVEQNFLPSTGKIEFLQLPSNHNIRIDSDLTVSESVETMFDSLLAKMIAYGNDRNEAQQNLIQALQQTIIHGIKTNIELHKLLLESNDFIHQKFYTRYIDDHLDLLIEKIKLQESEIDSLHIVLLASLVFLAQRNEKKHVWAEIGFWRVLPILCITVRNKQYHIIVEKFGSKHANLIYQNQKYDLRFENISSHNLSVTFKQPAPLDLKFNVFYTFTSEGKVFLTINNLNTEAVINHQFLNPDFDAQPSINFNEQNSLQIKAPLPGKIVKIMASEGDRIEKGSLVAIIESMKTENKLFAQESSRIKQVHVVEGQTVTLNQLLFSLEDNINQN